MSSNWYSYILSPDTLAGGVTTFMALSIRFSKPGKDEIFSQLPKIHTCFGAHLSSYSLGNVGSFSDGITAEVNSFNLSTATSVENQNEWSRTSIPPIYLPSVYRDNFAFTYHNINEFAQWNWVVNNVSRGDNFPLRPVLNF